MPAAQMGPTLTHGTEGSSANRGRSMTKAGDRREASDNLHASLNTRANECISKQSGRKESIQSDRFQMFQTHSRQLENSRSKRDFAEPKISGVRRVEFGLFLE